MWRPTVIALLVLLAGCSGVASNGDTTPTGTATTAGTATPAQTPSIANGTAVDRAVTAGKQRLRAALNDSAYSDISVPGYGATETAVLARNASGVYVEVSMPVGYQYDCQAGSGFVDDQVTAVYRVTGEKTTGISELSPICG